MTMPFESDHAALCAAFERIGLAIWVFDIDLRRVLWGNAKALCIWQAVSKEELGSRDLGLDMSASVADRLSQYQADFIARNATFEEHWTLYPGGLPTPLSVRLSGFELQDGRMAMLCEATPASSLAPASLRSVEALLHTAVMVTLYGNDHKALYRNPAARAACVATDALLLDRIANAPQRESFFTSLQLTGVATLTVKVSTPLGERWHELSARSCNDAITGQHSILCSEVDVTRIKRTEEHAHFLAQHDLLTGLPNRSEVIFEFERVVEAIRTSGEEAAMVFIDLDHFKNVNDTLGHAAGDQLLIEIAERLKQAIRLGDMVARLGGDEFLILVISTDVRNELTRITERLLKNISQPVSIHNTEVMVTPSVGVAIFPNDGGDVQTLMRNADLAMYAAKSEGRNGVAYYDSSMSESLNGRTALEAELRQAIARKEFVVFYQPRWKVNPDTFCAEIIGAEALVRWIHPKRGLLLPDVFIGACETLRLILPLGIWVLQQAAQQQRSWVDMGCRIDVSVNVSACQLNHPEFVDDVRSNLAASACFAPGIELEITESALLGQDSKSIEGLNTLVDMGFTIAVDDFGTGFSNLAYLQNFSIDTLKIDKTFVHGDIALRPISEVIVSMCEILGFKPVAEGIETIEQLQWLRSRGVQEFQGFLVARPMTADQLTAILQAGGSIPIAENQ